MIKSLFKFFIIIVCSTITLCFWLFGTESGLHFIYHEVVSYLPKELHIKNISGNLWHGVSINDLSYQDKTLFIKINSLTIQYNIIHIISNGSLHLNITLKEGNVIYWSNFSSNTKQAKTISYQKYLSYLKYVSIDSLKINHFNLQSANQKSNIYLAGYANRNNIDFYWKANISQLSEWYKDIKGSVISSGNIVGERYRPKIIFNLSIQHFVSQDIFIKNLTWKLFYDWKNKNTNQDILTFIGVTLNQIDFPTLTLISNNSFFENSLIRKTSFQFNKQNIANAIFKIDFSKKIADPSFILGDIFIKNTSLTIFKPLFSYIPKIGNTNGVLDGNIHMEGFYQPKLNAALQIHNGFIAIPFLNINLTPLFIKINYELYKPIYIQSYLENNRDMLNINGFIEINPLLLHFSIEGHDLLISNTDEYKIKINPSINMNYRYPLLSFQGKILIPYANIKPHYFENALTLSDDVIFTHQETEQALLKNQIEMNVDVALGQSIEITYEHFSGKLKGNLHLTKSQGGNILGQGELQTQNGIYEAYGKKLNIINGQFIYVSNPILNPGLNIRAIKELKHIQVKHLNTPSAGVFDNEIDTPLYLGPQTLRVGVSVKGTLKKPNIRLFSDPKGLSEADILSYLLFDVPQSEATLSDLAMMNVIQYNKNQKSVTEKFQNKLGLDSLDVGKTEYFNQANGNTQNVTTVNVSRHFGPNLSLNYSMGVFQNISIFSLHYQINKHLVLQTETSTLENGGDLLYQIERE